MYEDLFNLFAMSKANTNIGKVAQGIQVVLCENFIHAPHTVPRFVLLMSRKFGHLRFCRHNFYKFDIHRYVRAEVVAFRVVCLDFEESQQGVLS